mgnify:CR=1 FL=1
MDKAKGFMIVADEWQSCLDDFEADEVVEILQASLEYFQTGRVIEFNDRGMRQFLRSVIKTIDYSNEAFRKKCITNAYNRYKGICKDKEQTPLTKDEWYEQIYLPKANDRQRPLTVVDECDQ